MKTPGFITQLFSRDFTNYEGVRPIQIYILRLVFALTFVFIGMFSWTTIIGHDGGWKPVNAVAFSVWAAYSSLALLGILKPLKLLPIMVLMIFYKLIWLMVVAFPMWKSGTLIGSDAEQMTRDFMWVVLPIVAMPWGYFFRGFFGRKLPAPKNALTGSRANA
jgi:hypothetical protein